MDGETRAFWGDVTCGVVAAAFVAGLLVLGVRLRAVQVDGVAESKYSLQRQSLRRVQTDGSRGRILAADGTVLAGNRPTLSVSVVPSFFPGRTWEATSLAISSAVVRAEAVIGRPAEVGYPEIVAHVSRRLARPLEVWRDISELELARFSEHERALPGFVCEAGEVRVYPQKAMASQLVGYVGRAEVKSAPGARFNFHELEMSGRGGLEYQYDAFLRGVPGERDLQVDSRGFVHREWTVVEPKAGPDLRITLDPAVQRAAEAQLEGTVGACVVIDPRDGAVLAFASTPTIDLNRMVPRLTEACYAESSRCRNLASGGVFAPGSTFKPLTALAGLAAGVSPDAVYECTGAYAFSDMRIRCARTWGHGPLDVRGALRESCNAFFCNLGMTAGTNAVVSVARAFGLGERTGIDFPEDNRGLVPDAAVKRARTGVRWTPGDLAQMSIGQGMLLVTPLQMARVIGALGTGYLVTPRLKADLPVVRRPLEGVTPGRLAVVREGLAAVVDGGTGRNGGAGVDATVIGKTGTAEVGRGEGRYKNTWFVAYATPTASSRPEARERVVAVAMVVSHGESGGGTTAPRVAAVLRAIYNAPGGEGAE